MERNPTIHPPAGTLRNDATGEVFDLVQDVSLIGRSRESAVPVPDPRVSRRHAMIRRQDDGFWYFDLGSVNGSLINGRRVTTSQRLATGDIIQIADQRFRFESAGSPAGDAGATSIAERTIVEVRSRKVILLVSDIQGFTAISEKLTPDELAPIIGSWYSQTESILARHGANLDKFIGDCVLGYWLDTSPASRLAALKAAHAMRLSCDAVQDAHGSVLEPLGLRFTTGAAIHMGHAAYGAFSQREFTLLGDAVNLAFRLESLTRVLKHPVLVSADLFEGWPEGSAQCRCLGSHAVKGRDQLVEVHALEGDPEKSPA